MNKLGYSRALACYFVCVSFRLRENRELYAKINGKHMSMVHAGVKFKLSCTIYTHVYIRICIGCRVFNTITYRSGTYPLVAVLIDCVALPCLGINTRRIAGFLKYIHMKIAQVIPFYKLTKN